MFSCRFCFHKSCTSLFIICFYVVSFSLFSFLFMFVLIVCGWSSVFITSLVFKWRKLLTMYVHTPLILSFRLNCFGLFTSTSLSTPIILYSDKHYPVCSLLLHTYIFDVLDELFIVPMENLYSLFGVVSGRYLM